MERKEIVNQSSCEVGIFGKTLEAKWGFSINSRSIGYL